MSDDTWVDGYVDALREVFEDLNECPLESATVVKQWLAAKMRLFQGFCMEMHIFEVGK